MPPFAVLVKPAVLLCMPKFVTLATLGFPQVAALMDIMVSEFAILAKLVRRSLFWVHIQRSNAVGK